MPLRDNARNREPQRNAACRILPRRERKWTGRGSSSQKEISLLRDILREGKVKGTFDVDDCVHTAVIIIHTIHGLDVPYIRDNLTEQGISKTVLKDYISHLILYGIKKRHY